MVVFCIAHTLLHVFLDCVVYFHACDVNDVQEHSSEEQFPRKNGEEYLDI